MTLIFILKESETLLRYECYREEQPSASGKLESLKKKLRSKEQKLTLVTTAPQFV